MAAAGLPQAQADPATQPKSDLAAATSSTAPATPNFSRVIYDTYILGPGDIVFIELLDIPELSGTFSIGPDGTIYLPRLRALYVEGLSIEELRYFLTQQFKAYVKNPQIYINPVSYRAVRVYIGGEIVRPGYYTLSGDQFAVNQVSLDRAVGRSRFADPAKFSRTRTSQLESFDLTKPQNFKSSSSARWPTLFDALQAAQGVTPFSNLSGVQVVRQQPLGSGGGRIQANVDFLQLLTGGDENVNIRLFDGDVITVSRSPQVMRDQLLAASRTNLSPDVVDVFVSGRVKEPGSHSLPQGATLNQAIASAGGAKLLRGKVEFLRFSPDGETDRRLFSFDAGAKSGDYTNPVLMSGDVVRVNDSLLSASVEVFNELTGPFVGIYSVYSLFR
jgi:polysaccharide biosynthesis/export protein